MPETIQDAQVKEYSIQFSKRAFEIKRGLTSVRNTAADNVIYHLIKDPYSPCGNKDKIEKFRPRDDKILIYTIYEPFLEIMYEVDRENEVILFHHFGGKSIRPI